MKIAAITMAKDDDFFLTRWINYYGRELGYENLYIYLDGNDQKKPINSIKTNIKNITKKKELSRTKGDKYRINLLNNLSHSLFDKGYDIVIGCDCDEFLVVDPKINKSLKDYLSKIKFNVSLSGLGLDVGQDLKNEKELDITKSFLSQRSFAFLSTRYTKPVVINKKVKWGSGFHSIKKHNFHIDPNLYLMHFGSVDFNMIKNKIKIRDKDWENHLNRRAETCYIVTKSRKKDFYKYTKISRFIQKIFRPIYAWNKPFMFGLKFTVKIPEILKKIGI